MTLTPGPSPTRGLAGEGGKTLTPGPSPTRGLAGEGGLTVKQARVLAFIGGYIARMGYAPTLHEIGANLGTSVSNAWRYVNALQAAGRVTSAQTEQGHRGTRTLRVIREQDQ